MGVPAFFRWLTKKYPSIATQCHEEKAKKNDFTDEKIPVDTSQPNPNGVEFDNLYLDMNGIIHPCTHPEDRPAPKNEEEMMLIIFEFIDRIFSIVRPRKVLYMAIDGVAPRAKMNQQRSRRFRAAKDNCEKASEIKRLKEQIISNGGTVPPCKPDSEKFDSNCITPGTPFMHKLAHCLRYYVHDRLNSDPGWKNIVVMLSDANVPGEGEHKIMDYIRRQRANPDHDPNTHHVLCGADADLIMLGLATHEPYFTIIREEFKPNQPRPCEVCNQFGHETKECTGLTREKSGAYDEMANTVTPSETNYIFLRLSILKEYLSKELSCISNNASFKFDLERAIDDWVFMCFFVGNDFLPHLPSLEIRENAIDRLVNLYKTMINQAGGYLTDCGDVNLGRVQFILSGIGEVEDDIFKKRQKNETEFRNRRKQQNKRNMRMGQDMPSQMPSWMKTGPYAPTPLGRKPNPVATQNKFELMEDKTETIVEDSRGVKRKMTDVKVEVTKKINPDEIEIDEKVEVTTVTVEEKKKPVEEDEDANDPVRLWEDGWKDRYYKVKFDVSEDDYEFRQKVAKHYVIGLQWVLKYYYQGVPSWGWYFPYHYAPFASDFNDIADAHCDFNEGSEPFNPFDQLMAVFPAASKQHVPRPWQTLMTDVNSSIIDFYPEDFQVDLNGKKQSWQGVALLPFVDAKRLKIALEAVQDQLNPEEKKRNTRGNDSLFVSKSHSLYEFVKKVYEDGSNKFNKHKTALEIDTSFSNGIGGKIWCDEHVCLEGEVYKSPLGRLVPELTHNQVLAVHYHDPTYESAFWHSKILKGAIIPEPTLKPGDWENRNHGGQYRPNTGFNRNNDYRNNKNPAAANRFIQNSLNMHEREEVGSSANGGHGSVYGTYKTSSNNYNSEGGYNNNYNNNRGGYQGNGNNYNNRGNNNYNNYNQGGGYNNNQGGGYNKNYNNRGGNNNYNNDQRGGYGNGNFNNNNQRGGYNNSRGGNNNYRGGGGRGGDPNNNYRGGGRGGSQNYNYNQ